MNKISTFSLFSTYCQPLILTQQTDLRHEWKPTQPQGTSWTCRGCSSGSLLSLPTEALWSSVALDEQISRGCNEHAHTRSGEKSERSGTHWSEYHDGQCPAPSLEHFPTLLGENLRGGSKCLRWCNSAKVWSLSTTWSCSEFSRLDDKESVKTRAGFLVLHVGVNGNGAWRPQAAEHVATPSASVLRCKERNGIHSRSGVQVHCWERSSKKPQRKLKEVCSFTPTFHWKKNVFQDEGLALCAPTQIHLGKIRFVVSRLFAEQLSLAG